MHSCVNLEALITLRSSFSKSFLFSIQDHLASALSALPMPLHICWGEGMEGRSYACVWNSPEVPRAFGERDGTLRFLYRSNFLPWLFADTPPFFLNLWSSFLHLCSSVSVLQRALYVWNGPCWTQLSLSTFPVAFIIQGKVSALPDFISCSQKPSLQLASSCSSFLMVLEFSMAFWRSLCASCHLGVDSTLLPTPSFFLVICCLFRV